jgi:predicted nucleic acid-binding protein
MKTIVVDASVILKWVLGDEREEDQGKAMELLHAWAEGRCELAAPSLWAFEAGNVLGRFLDKEAEAKMGLLLGLGIRNVELTPEMSGMIASWMRDKAVNFYDAAYLAAAHDCNALLVTADPSFARKMRDVQGICLLQNLKL